MQPNLRQSLTSVPRSFTVQVAFDVIAPTAGRFLCTCARSSRTDRGLPSVVIASSHQSRAESLDRLVASISAPPYRGAFSLPIANRRLATMACRTGHPDTRRQQEPRPTAGRPGFLRVSYFALPAPALGQPAIQALTAWAVPRACMPPRPLHCSGCISPYNPALSERWPVS